MKKKRLFALALTCLLVLAMLTGCGGSADSQTARAAALAVQGTSVKVPFGTSSQLDRLLRAAARSGRDAAGVLKALQEELGLSGEELAEASAVKDGQTVLTVYQLPGSLSASAAAAQAASQLLSVLNALPGGTFTGQISMVKQGGSYYVAAVIYAGSVSSGGGIRVPALIGGEDGTEMEITPWEDGDSFDVSVTL